MALKGFKESRPAPISAATPTGKITEKVKSFRECFNMGKKKISEKWPTAEVDQRDSKDKTIEKVFKVVFVDYL